MKSIAKSYQDFADRLQKRMAKKGRYSEVGYSIPPPLSGRRGGETICMKTNVYYGIFLVTSFIGIKVIKSFISSNLDLFIPGT